MMTSEEEMQCIRAVLAGNLDEFEKLITDNKIGALSIAESMVKDKFEANDVLQEAYINAFNYLHTFNGASRFGTWFYRIVVNQSLKWLRKRKRLSEIQNTVHQTYKLVDKNHGLEQLEKHEKKQSIQKVLKQLKPKEALMLNMFYLQEFSMKEIQEITGFSISNIKVLLHRARASFSHYHNQIIKKQ